MSTTRSRIWIPVILTLLLVISLVPKSSFAAEEAEWWNFRNNYENNGITDRAVPNSDKEAALKWAAKLGSGWAASPTPPVIVNGNPYVGSGNKIYKLDRDTGKVLQTSGKMVGNVGFAMNPILYAEGMFFVQIGNGTIQAMDAATLQPLWSTKRMGGQTVSPIAYRQIDGEGHLYLGTWTGEKRDGTFFAVTTTDEDPTRGDEVKDPAWTFVPAEDDADLADHPNKNRGFYWAGAYAAEKYVAVGSDDGTNEGDYTANAVFYTLNPKTGKIIDRLDGVKGDIRTTVVYDNGHLYFSTKGGDLYRVPVDENGKLSEADKISLGGMTTASPVVYKDKLYIGVAGKGGQFDPDGDHRFAVIKNVPGEDLVEEHGLIVPGYPQAGALLSTAYESKDFNGDGNPDGRVYIYFTYNSPPGGLYYTYYEPGMTEAPKAEPLFIPPAEMQQHCISTICADTDGTMYYKNDSGNVMAIETNPAYLDHAVVTPDVGEAIWSENFETGINKYTVKVQPENNKVRLSLTMPEGVSATVNETAYDPATGMELTLDEQGKYEAVVKVSIDNHSREYTITVEREAQTATLKDLKVSNENQYDKGLFSLTPAFHKDIHEYTTELLPQERGFYNVWCDAEHPKAKVQVFPGENVDISDTAEFIQETGEFKVTNTNFGHARYAIYAKDLKLDSEVLIRVTSESGQHTKEYKLTLSRTVYVSDVDLEPKTLEVVEGTTGTLTPIFNPTNASIKDVTWSSGDESIATVEDGTVTGVRTGETTVTVTTVDGDKTAETTIKVISVDDYKTSAKASLDSYKDSDDYRIEQKAELAAAIANGKTAIDKATDKAEVDAAVASAKAAMDKIKTDAQLAEDETAAAAAVDKKIEAIGEVTLEKKADIEAARAAYDGLSGAAKDKVTKLSLLEAAEAKLAELKAADGLIKAKEDAKTELENYKKPADYRDAQKTELANAIAAGKTAIDSATNEADIDAAVTAAKAAMDKIKTDAQLTEEEAAADKAAAEAVDAKIAAIGEVTLEKKADIEAARAAYDGLSDAAKGKVTKLSLLEAAEAKLAELEAADGLIKAKEDAKKELESYKKPADYRDAQKTELANAIAAGKTAIDNATNEADIDAAVGAAKTAMDKIKTDAQLTEEEAAVVDGKIEAISEVTLEKKADIEAARTAYDGLSDAAKGKVTKLSVLEAAEAKLAELEAAATQEELDKAAAKDVEDKINAIGKPDLSKEAEIAEVRAAFDKLTPAQKAFVPNEDALKAAEAKIAGLLKEPLIQIDYDRSSQTNDAKAFLWIKGESEELRVRVLAGYETFLEKVVLDGMILDSTYYTVTDGSIVVDFDKTYLDALAAGEHDFEVYTKDGYAAGKILVSVKKDPEKPIVDPEKPIVDPDKPVDPGKTGTTDTTDKAGAVKDAKSSNVKPAKTDDSVNTGIIWIVGMAALLLGLGGIISIRRKQRSDQ